MSPIDAHWLHERGLLHGALITAVHHKPGYLQIDIEDEWVSERGGAMPRGETRPVALCFQDAAVAGLFAQGMRLAELSARGKGTFQLIFMDKKGSATVQASRAECHPLRRPG